MKQKSKGLSRKAGISFPHHLISLSCIIIEQEFLFSPLPAGLGLWGILDFPLPGPFPLFVTSVNLIYIFLTAWPQILHIREHQQLQNILRKDYSEMLLTWWKSRRGGCLPEGLALVFQHNPGA